MEGVRGIGSELERVHIAEKNKAMAAKLKVRVVTVEELVFVLFKEIGFCVQLSSVVGPKDKPRYSSQQ